MLRALLTATPILKTVESAMRRSPMMEPSRSATAMTIRVREPFGKRIAARVVLAVASALFRIVWTSDVLKPPSGPAAGAIRSPSGGCPALFVGATKNDPVPATGPAETALGRDVWLTNGSATPPINTTPGDAGVGPKTSDGPLRWAVATENAANSATLRSVAVVTTPIP